MPSSMIQSLKSKPTNPTLTQNDTGLIFDTKMALPFCGSNVYIGVMVDMYDSVFEKSETNNMASISATVTGCQGRLTLD